jgi:hypothetical protein
MYRVLPTRMSGHALGRGGALSDVRRNPDPQKRMRNRRLLGIAR